MAKTQFISAATGQLVAADRYNALVSGLVPTSIEADTQVTMNQAGTFSNLGVNVTANTATACTIYFRKNGVNGAQNVAYTSGQTGIKEDLSNTDAVVAGDEVNTFFDVTSGSSMNMSSSVTTFDSSSGYYQLYTANRSGITQNDNITNYRTFNWEVVSTTETNVQCKMQTAGTFKHFFVYVTANTHTTAATDFYLSVNASTAGCPTVNYAATQTGIKEDTSTNRAVVYGDLCNFKIVTAANAGTTTTTYSTISCGFASTTGKYQQFVAMNEGTATASTTYYTNVSGGMNLTTTQSQRQITHRGETKILSEFGVEVSSNGRSTDTTIAYMNGATAYGTITYTSGQTGVKTSNPNIRIENGDLLSLRIVTSTGSGTITFQQFVSILEPVPQFFKTNRINFDEIDEGAEIG